MSEQEKAIARACLEQTALALYEARELRGFWDSLGSDVKMRWADFQADVHAVQISLRESPEPWV
jgi:hypothetical protein